MTLYNSLLNHQKVDEDLVAIHVCSFHVRKFLNEQVDDIVKKEKAKLASEQKKTKNVVLPSILQEKEQLLRSWGHKLVVASSYDELVHRMREIIVLTGSTYYTNEVKQIVKNFGGQVDQQQDYRRFQYTQMKNESFYKRSPFGQIAQQIFAEVEEENRRLRQQVMTKKLSLRENSFSQEDFLSYLLIHVLPYAPLLTHCVFTAHEIATDGDTNNNVENWMKTIKCNYLQRSEFSPKGIRASRLARIHATMIKGNSQKSN